MILSESLATGLGRRDLTYRNALASTGVPPAIPGGGSSTLSLEAGGGVDAAFSTPIIGLMVLIVGVGAFAWWVRPHLA